MTALSLLVAPSSYGALSAVSANTISGSMPTIVGNDRLGFEVKGVKFSQALNNIDSNVIQEFDAELKLSDFVITNLAAEDYYDADGDEADPTTPFSIGGKTAEWYESDGTPITDTDKMVGCGSNLKLPLKLKIEIFDVQAHSKFGDPRDSELITLTKEYQIGTSSEICFLRPNQIAVRPRNSWVSNNNGNWAWNFENPARDPEQGGGYSSDFVIFKNVSGTVVDGGFRANATPTFPTTGFPGAQFSLVMKRNASAYTFESNAKPAVTVDDDGKVTLNSKPSGAVKITATLKADTSQKHSYEFDPRTVWVVPEPDAMDYATAVTRCGSESQIPTRAQLTNSPQNAATASDYPYVNFFTRATGGGVFNEWGWPTSDNYPESQWFLGWVSYWTNEEIPNSDEWFIVDSHNGHVNRSNINGSDYLACLR
ncbi:hypothetical protein RCS94_00325 [Orbaceae bacterium ac157xtp]